MKLLKLILYTTVEDIHSFIDLSIRRHSGDTRANEHIIQFVSRLDYAVYDIYFAITCLTNDVYEYARCHNNTCLNVPKGDHESMLFTYKGMEPQHE